MNLKNKVKILDVYIDKITYSDAISKINKFLKSDNKNYIVTPNPEFLIDSTKNVEFKNILNSANMAIADGIGLLWAAKFLSLPTYKFFPIKFMQSILQLLYSGLSLIFYPKYCRSIIPQRVTGSDLMWKIIKLAEQYNSSIYLLGAMRGIAEKCSEIILNKYPHLKITGYDSSSPSPDIDLKIVSKINNKNPDILFVAYGAPKQEKWIANNLKKLSSVKLAIGVGGAFDFIAGKVKRAPLIFRKFGLEWLYRLYKEPKRIKRIYNAACKFPYLIFIKKLKNNFHE